VESIGVFLQRLVLKLDSFNHILILVGAIALFMFGMKITSESIQKLAGNRLREILNKFTSNRIKGVITGLFTTTLIQTSTATTVMVVGFVNAGLIALHQAITLIIGSNIGTTIKAWLFAFSLERINMESLALFAAAIALPLVFNRRNRVKSIGEFLFGFGLMFIALGFLKQTSEHIENQEWFIRFISSISGSNFGSVLAGILTGMLLTMIVQSSSVMMARTIVLSQKGLLPFEFAAAMVLGENIGTTVTANLAALLTNRNGKRAALAHTLFNLIGVLLFLPFFYLIIDLLEFATTSFFMDSTSMEDQNKGPIALALLHSGFNLIIGILAIILLNPFEKLCYLIIPLGSAEMEDSRLTMVQHGLIRTPELILGESNREIDKLARLNKEMLQYCDNLLITTDEKQLQHLLQQMVDLEALADRTEENISGYLNSIIASELSAHSQEEARSLSETTKDLEEMSDVFYAVGKIMERKFQEKIWFNPDQRNKVREMIAMLKEALTIMHNNIQLGYGKGEIKTATQIEDRINTFRDELRVDIIEQQKEKEYNQRSSAIFSDLINSHEKAADLMFSISRRTAKS
jgi:phosphate:Na+ symporter